MFIFKVYYINNKIMKNEEEIDPNNIIEIKTVQSSAIKILVEALKEILTDANLIFDKNGIKLILKVLKY